MDIGAYIGCSGAIANRRVFETVTHNLANASTPGFKKVLQQHETLPFDFLTEIPTGQRPSEFVQLIPAIRDLSQGGLGNTGHPFDLAIHGEGYFLVSTPQGPEPTRDGRFNTMTDGTLINHAGHAVLDEKGSEINIVGNGSVKIFEDGEIHVDGKSVGKIGLVDAQGNALDEPAAKIVQGHLEKSNVKPVEEMIKIMGLMRGYQFYTNLIGGIDKLETKAISELGRL